MNATASTPASVLDLGDEVRPSDADELNLKAIDAVTWLVSSYEEGQISYEAVSIGLQAVFKTCNGFILPEVREAIEQACKANRLGLEHLVVLVHHEAGTTRVAQLHWAVGSSSVKVLVMKIQSGHTEPPSIDCQTKSFDDHDTPASAARAFFTKTVDTLTKRGYSVLGS